MNNFLSCIVPALILCGAYFIFGDSPMVVFVLGCVAVLMASMLNFRDGLNSGISIGRRQVFAYVHNKFGRQEADRLFGKEE